MSLIKEWSMVRLRPRRNHECWMLRLQVCYAIKCLGVPIMVNKVYICTYIIHTYKVQSFNDAMAKIKILRICHKLFGSFLNISFLTFNFIFEVSDICLVEVPKVKITLLKFKKFKSMIHFPKIEIVQ